MNNEKTVYVSWYNCDCAEYFGYTSKYCDEEHRSGARVPVSVLETYTKGARNGYQW